MKNEENFSVRERELELFKAFTSAALAVINNQRESLTIADACRLVDIALKAVHGSSNGPVDVQTKSDTQISDEVHAAYRLLLSTPNTTRKGDEHVSN